MDKNHCATCGRPRGISVQRESWGLDCKITIVPRTGDNNDKPAQQTNDLIYTAAVWRNGGTSENTHLCDDCLRIGLRAIKLQVDQLLGEIEVGADKDAELAELTDRLGRIQCRYSNLAHDHNRMQDRLKAVVAFPGKAEVENAEYEISRGHHRLEYA